MYFQFTENWVCNEYFLFCFKLNGILGINEIFLLKWQILKKYLHLNLALIMTKKLLQIKRFSFYYPLLLWRMHHRSLKSQTLALLSQRDNTEIPIWHLKTFQLPKLTHFVGKNGVNVSIINTQRPDELWRHGDNVKVNLNLLNRIVLIKIL